MPPVLLPATKRKATDQPRRGTTHDLVDEDVDFEIVHSFATSITSRGHHVRTNPSPQKGRTPWVLRPLAWGVNLPMEDDNQLGLDPLALDPIEMEDVEPGVYTFEDGSVHHILPDATRAPRAKRARGRNSVRFHHSRTFSRFLTGP